MMGKDVERILAGINNIKDTTVTIINLLSDAISYRISIDTGMDSIDEHEVPMESNEFTEPIDEAVEIISNDLLNMESLSNGLYTSINEFNNGYGSPWTELSILTSSIENMKTFVSSHELKWIGEKMALLGLLNIIHNASIDSKWALIYYHDYIQRGYDNKFNGNEPSIKFTSGLNKESIGNINHEYHENVNIKMPSIDPF